MARLVVGAAIGVLIGIVVGAALDLSAEPGEELATVAAEANVPVQDLEGAAASTGLSPREYVWMSGELERPSPVAPASQAALSAATVSGVWLRLSQCESGGNWSIISRGGTYRGGLQFDQQTWAAYGGRAYASSAHLATPSQQIAVAERLRAARGYQPWPACRRILRLP